ncbi:MAG TPA: MCE family protein [Pseudonocardiaceae bacterium]
MIGRTRRWRRTRRPALLAVAAGSVIALLSGCQYDGLYSTPLPGGADLGPHPYTVRAEFADVLDLVPQAAVRVNDVPVGTVKAISLNTSNWTADVTMSVNGDVTLPANADAELRQSSLLGEKYVELVAPTGGGTGRLGDGALIPLSRTNRNVEVEEVLGALSLVLNGGGIQQIRTIAQELNQVSAGNEPQIRELLSNVDTLVADLNAHSADITRALDGVNRLSAELAAQTDQIAGVLNNLTPGLATLNSQRDQLVGMLKALTNLSGVAVNTVNASQADLVADLKALAPTLQHLADAGSSLPDSLQLLLTYPFTDGAAAGAKGDYENLYATLDLNLQDLLSTLARSQQSLLPTLPGTGGSTSGTTSGTGSGGTSALPLGSTAASTPSGTCAGGLTSLLGSLLGGC